MGVLLNHCPKLITDLNKIIGAFGFVAQHNGTLPIQWDPEYTTIYNRSNPMRLLLNGILSKVYISVSI